MPVFGRRHASLVFEVFPEKRLGREIQLVGNLLDTHIGVFQQVFRFEYHIVVYPLCRRFARQFLDQRREIFGRDAQLFGIEGNASFLHVVLREQSDESPEDNLLTVFFIFVFGDRGVVQNQVVQLPDERASQVLECFHLFTPFCRLADELDQRYELAEDFDFVFGES